MDDEWGKGLRNAGTPMENPHAMGAEKHGQDFARFLRGTPPASRGAGGVPPIWLPAGVTVAVVVGAILSFVPVVEIVTGVLFDPKFSWLTVLAAAVAVAVVARAMLGGRDGFQAHVRFGPRLAFGLLTLAFWLALYVPMLDISFGMSINPATGRIDWPLAVQLFALALAAAVLLVLHRLPRSPKSAGALLLNLAIALGLQLVTIYQVVALFYGWSHYRPG